VLREDLYYRLRVVPIHVPPLRERPSDIPLLAQHFLSHFWVRHRGAGAPMPEFTEAATRSLRARPWKGNVRELENLMEHIVVLVEPGSPIRPEDIPAMGEPASEEPRSYLPSEVTTDEPYYSARDRLVAAFELQYLTQLVTEAGGNMSRAARTAGVDRTTLYRLMERHGLHRKLPTTES
jgi:DNA-binding NtrC family response regulator